MRELWREFKNQQKKGKYLEGADLTCGPVCSSLASPQSTPGHSCWVVWSVCARQWTQCRTGWRPPARRRCTSCEGGRRCAWSRTWPASRSEHCTSRWRRDICTPESWSASPPGKETRPVTQTAYDLWICHLTPACTILKPNMSIFLTFLPARLLCKFMSARASLSFLSLASTKAWLKRMACSTWSLQPPQSKEPLASRDEPFLVGSQEQESSSPWLQARANVWTTPAEEIAYMKATSRLPEGRGGNSVNRKQTSLMKEGPS